MSDKCKCMSRGAAETTLAGDAVGMEKSGFPYWVAFRRRFEPNSPFFASGNLERELLAKQVALDLTEDERHQIHDMEEEKICKISCPIVGCGVQLSTLDDFEDHYHTRHSVSCSVCSRIYPTSRLLSIHISETHDSFFQAKVARGFAMYECLVEGCNAKLKSYKSRQQHLIDKHKFPSSFEFFKKAHSSQKQRQKFQRRKPSSKMEERKENDMDVETKIDDLTSAVSKLRTSDSSPSAISFGHRHSRGISFLPHSVQRNKKLGSMQTKNSDTKS